MNFNLSKKNKTDSWVTPKWIIDSIGISDLDVCGYKHPEKGILVETAKKYYFIEDDGLNQKWAGSVFMNPLTHKINYGWLKWPNIIMGLY